MLTRAAAHDLLTALQPEVQPEVQPDVQPEVPPEPPLETAPAVEPSPAEQTKPRLRPARTPKLNLKVHVEQIQTLRARWKELDRLGSPASQTLWLRFDTALRAAYEPVAVQQAAQKAARQDNLLAREALLGVLENLPSPEITPDAASAAPSPVDWRESTLALQRFQLAWRQLGPVEHTVPAGARQALGQRLHRALERVEAPLQAARQAAAHQREALITRAEALLHPGAGNAPVADAPRLVRELQAQWQEQARQLALPRGLENALWARFKTATDAVFVQRDAAFAARDGELVQNLAAREALLTRLTDLNADTAVADIERTLTEVDRAWRQATELPRGTGPALEVRLRAAHAAALALLHGAAQQGWWLQCDRLSARLALCAERETLAADADPGLLDQRWAAAGELPAAWAQALAPRWAKAQPAGPLMEAAFDDVLLQLETALEMPAAPDHHQARRLLKLRTLKDTLEGRTPALTGPAKPADWLAASLRQARLSAAQRARLRAVLAALRAAPPGALGLPMGAV